MLFLICTFILNSEKSSSRLVGRWFVQGEFSRKTVPVGSGGNRRGRGQAQQRADTVISSGIPGSSTGLLSSAGDSGCDACSLEETTGKLTLIPQGPCRGVLWLVTTSLPNLN